MMIVAIGIIIIGELLLCFGIYELGFIFGERHSNIVWKQFFGDDVYDNFKHFVNNGSINKKSDTYK